jgi:hypothetical protein
MHTFIKVLEWRAKRQPDEVVAWRVVKIPAVCGVDIEKYSWDDNCLFLEKRFKERETIVNRVREIFQV